MEIGYLENKVIFITGAGSIGCKLLEYILRYNIDSVRILDNSEIKLHNLKQRYKDRDNIVYIFGDIRDKNRLEIAMRGVDIVFHTAAMKHVSICEDNPIDAINSNVIGCQNIINISIKEKCDKVINISTDKAVSPINVMGATKLLTERLIASAEIYKGPIDTTFTSIRFGNVMKSSGSVMTIFRYQIKNNKEITVTDKEMTRFMMSIDDAIKLILRATDISIGGEIFILKMPSVKIIDLIEAMSPDYKNIRIIGRYPGEKLHEDLLTDDEMEMAYENDEMLVVCNKDIIDYYERIGFKKVKENIYKSDSNLLSVEDIRKIL